MSDPRYSSLKEPEEREKPIRRVVDVFAHAHEEQSEFRVGGDTLFMSVFIRELNFYVKASEVVEMSLCKTLWKRSSSWLRYYFYWVNHF
jgi:hypothetical protein